MWRVDVGVSAGVSGGTPQVLEIMKGGIVRVISGECKSETTAERSTSRLFKMDGLSRFTSVQKESTTHAAADRQEDQDLKPKAFSCFKHMQDEIERFGTSDRHKVHVLTTAKDPCRNIVEKETKNQATRESSRSHVVQMEEFFRLNSGKDETQSAAEGPAYHSFQGLASKIVNTGCLLCGNMIAVVKRVSLSANTETR